MNEREIHVKAGVWEAIGQLGFEEAYRRLTQPDPLAEAVRRMESVPVEDLADAFLLGAEAEKLDYRKSRELGVQAVRTLLLQTVKENQP